MQNQVENRIKPIALFLLITFLLSSIFYYLIIDAGTLAAGGGIYVLGLMWCPGIAALFTLVILKRSLKELGWKWGKTKYQIQSYFIPIIYALVAYLIIWGLGWGKFYNEEFVTVISNSLGLKELDDTLIIAIYVLQEAIIGILLGAIFALGEEIGWRGFLTPELYKTQGFTKTSLITGLVWGIWHLPILLFADYNSGTPVWYAMSCFIVLVIGISFIYTWMRMKTGSLWTAVLLHASHNSFIQNVFTPLTEDTGNTAYYVDEFGIVLPVITLGFAVYFWNKRSELEPVTNEV